MPLLLRRALSQLRGDAPEFWPNGPELVTIFTPYKDNYPFPILMQKHAPLMSTMPHLQDLALQGELRKMLDRLANAKGSRISAAWKKVVECYSNTEPYPSDPGLEVLQVLGTALRPISTLDSVACRVKAAQIRKAAKELVIALEDFENSGGQLERFMPERVTELPEVNMYARFTRGCEGSTNRLPASPQNSMEYLWVQFVGLSEYVPRKIFDVVLTDPNVLLALLRVIAKRKDTPPRQLRGPPKKRQAFVIANQLQGLLGPQAAVTIACAATGATITTKALAKKRN
jgi:hypothetical protein